MVDTKVKGQNGEVENRQEKGDCIKEGLEEDEFLGGDDQVDEKEEDKDENQVVVDVEDKDEEMVGNDDDDDDVGDNHDDEEDRETNSRSKMKPKMTSESLTMKLAKQKMITLM